MSLSELECGKVLSILSKTKRRCKAEGRPSDIDKPAEVTLAGLAFYRVRSLLTAHRLPQKAIAVFINGLSLDASA